MAKRGPYEKGEAKRKEILQAALEIFAAEGYRGTSLRKVAAKCSLSLPGLMHYFESKEDLLTQVLRMRDESARMRHEYRPQPERYQAVIQEAADTPGLVELFVSMAAAGSDPKHPAHTYFADRYPSMREQLAEHLRKRMDEGALRSSVPPDRLAALAIAAIDGIQLQWLTDHSVDMQQPIDDLVSLLTPDA
ncbi:MULTISPECIES: helix-turn-helix domain-containing protein [unclassified Streptomyces]|uniref:TetR/AcrR family transcriptional regulator n=1 Tax=unclassified Streptomyces TaxID=2593676 RepID=UPI002E18B954|nr:MULTISPECIES: helix-turn-helix domain-containing protein [unclassified Streptomyces]